MDDDSKPCSKCGTVYPLADFTSSPRSRDGRHSWCRPCLRALARKNYDSARARARHAALKADPDYVAKRKAIYDRWRAEHPDLARAATVAWRDANRDHVRVVFREWEDANRTERRMKRRSYSRARDARKRMQSTGDPVDYAAILTEHGMVCHLDGLPIASLDDLHFDHVIPLIKGGPHAAANIRPAHALCNMRKGDRIA